MAVPRAELVDVGGAARPRRCSRSRSGTARPSARRRRSPGGRAARAPSRCSSWGWSSQARLLGTRAEACGETVGVGGPRLGVDQAGWHLAREDRDPLLRGGARDVARRLDRDPRGVRAGDDRVEREQRMAPDRAARRGTRRCRRPRSCRSPSASYSAASSCTGPRAVVTKNAVGFMRANCSAPMSPSVSGVNGQFRCTKSERSSSSSSSTFVTPRAAASSSERYGSYASTVIANGAHSSTSRPPICPTPTMPSVLPSSSLLRSGMRSWTTLASDHAVGERDLLRQREHEAERVLRHRLATGTRVVAHDHAGRGARLDVDDVVARARRADGEQVGAALEERRPGRSTARRRRGCGPARCG